MRTEREIVLKISGENLEITNSGLSDADEDFLAHIQNHSVENYRRYVAHLLHTESVELAMAKAIGCQSMDEWIGTGNGQVAVLRHHGLQDGMSIYDLGCGSGRTASALLRADWKGHYRGHDIVEELVDYLRNSCPGYEAAVNRNLTLLAESDSLDMVFHWSVFTHLFIEECYLYLEDIYRGLKPGGKLVFSFLELENSQHLDIVFADRVEYFRDRRSLGHLDTFLHRSQIRLMAERIGFDDIAFTDGADGTQHPPFWQSLVSMRK